MSVDDVIVPREAFERLRAALRDAAGLADDGDPDAYAYLHGYVDEWIAHRVGRVISE